MENKILYSIITPVYNRADCIMRCMQSVEKSMQNQFWGGNIEHVIVDDGSLDSTASIVEDYAKQHPHVVFVKFPQNRGTNAARNEAIRRARGKWIVILDSDDYFCDTAISNIDQTIRENPSFGHYAFAADDMQGYYKDNLIIKGANRKVLSYPDFLNGYVNCDFIHVMQREVLLRHPFDEELRIYEGLFFLLFYRDVHQVLFTNKVVTVRERQRADSVSRDFIRTKIDIVRKNARSQKLMLQYFGNDLRQLGMVRQLHNIKISLFESYVLLGEYDKAKSLDVGAFWGRKEKLYHLFCCTHTGWYYRQLLQFYLFIKYKLLKKKLKV